jgi:hypothetical protein
MTEPDEPDTEQTPDEPATVTEAVLTASGVVGPGPGQTEDDVPAQDEE